MNDKELEQQAIQALDKSNRALSPETRQRLYEARQTALSKHNRAWFKRPIIGFALASSFSMVLLLNYLPEEQGVQDTELAKMDVNNSGQATAFDDLMFLASFDETDIAVAEDIEFAYWLSEQLENDSTTETRSDGERRNG